MADLAPSLATFHQRVSRAIRRGKVYDGDIPTYAKDAVRTLENINNWRHMWVESFNQTLAIGANTIVLERVKSIRYIRLHVLRSDSTLWRYKYMAKVSPMQVIAIKEEGNPVGYWMQDQDTVILDAKPTEAQTYDIGYYQYSEYDDDLPWLTIAENLLIAQTMIEMSPLLRDDKSQARWIAQKGEKLSILEESDLVHEFDGQIQSMIPYADDMDEFQISGANTDVV